MGAEPADLVLPCDRADCRISEHTEFVYGFGECRHLRSVDTLRTGCYAADLFVSLASYDRGEGLAVHRMGPCADLPVFYHPALIFSWHASQEYEDKRQTKI